MSSTAVTQARIHAIVKANPGIHTAQVAMILGLAWNTTMHHVRSMERDSRVTVQKIDGKIRLFDRKQGAFAAKQAAAVLQDPQNRTIAAYVLSNPGRTQRQLAAALDLSTTAVHRRLSRMEDAGLLQRLAAGRCTLVQPSESLPDVFVRAGIRTSQVHEGGEPQTQEAAATLEPFQRTEETATAATGPSPPTSEAPASPRLFVRPVHSAGGDTDEQTVPA